MIANTREAQRARARAHQEATRRGGAAKVSLNPAREAEDAKQFTITFSDPGMRTELERAWLIVLGHGEALRTGVATSDHVRRWALRAGFAAERQNDPGMGIVGRALDLFVDEQYNVRIDGFVKALYYMGFEKYNIPDDAHQVALRKILDDVVIPYNAAHRKSQECDGGGSDEAILSIPEIDRLLYVYDTVLERLFHRYRAVDRHANRELTLDQNLLLDQFVEVEEVKEMMKDYNLFPRSCAYADCSRACQYACFGKIVVDPTRQGAGRWSDINAKADSNAPPDPNAVVAEADEAERRRVATAADAAAVAVTVEAPNPLYVPLLPPEYLTDEALLDKPRFMSMFVRLSQILFSRPDNNGEHLPTMASRVEALLAAMAPTYERQFQRTMESDCDYTERGLPVLVPGTAALSPPEGPMRGFELAIAGGNFCEKRGVFVRFGLHGAAGTVVVRSKSIARRRIVVDAPPMQPKDIEVQAEHRDGEYDLYLNKIARVPIEASNNRWQYTTTNPPIIVLFRQELPPHALEEPTAIKLQKLFAAVCSHNDAFNKKLMSLTKWRLLKEFCELSEAIDGGVDQDAFFMEVAEFHDGAHELSLNFKGFLRVLVRTLVEMLGDGWIEALRFISNKRFEAARREGVEDDDSGADQGEIAMARRALALVERRATIELDVYMGPVLCGTVVSRGGGISTVATTGITVAATATTSQISYCYNNSRCGGGCSLYGLGGGPGAPPARRFYPYNSYGSYGGSGNHNNLTNSTEGTISGVGAGSGPAATNLTGTFHDHKGSAVTLMQHPTLSYLQYDLNTQSAILAHINNSHNILHFLRRLLADGFDVAPHNSNVSSRRPVGRCWAVTVADGAARNAISAGINVTTSRVGERIGALWDYPGNYSNLEWQPAALELQSRHFTMCSYVEERCLDYVLCYLCFSRAQSIGQLRELLRQRGYELTSQLYRIP